MLLAIFVLILGATTATSPPGAPPAALPRPGPMMPGMPPGELRPPRAGTYLGDPLAPDYDVVDYLWEINDHWFHIGEHERCIELNQHIIELDPTFVEAYLVTAWLQDSADRFADARATLEQGMIATPDHYQLYFDLGWYHTRHRDFEGALPWYRKAANLECPPEVPRMVAHTLEKLGRLQECLDWWRELQLKYPDDQVVLHNLRRVEARLKAGSGTP